MISIISGKYKGKKLYSIKKTNVRPTQAKVRKSIFQILEPFNNMIVLDLFAGFGTLGIEALSRGAEKVIFVEQNKLIFQTLKKNINLLNLSNCEYFLTDAIQFLPYTKTSYFDIIFADPPYSTFKFDDLKQKVEKLLKPNGIFCMEMRKETVLTSEVRINYYGNTQVVFWRNI